MEAFTVIAAAGGGSAGFHGGGGGGGSGKIFILLWLFAHPVVLAVVVAGVLCLYLYNQAQTARGRARRHKRGRRVELAAAEAAEDDAAFSPDHVKERAADLFKKIQFAWDAASRGRLTDLVGPDLMVEWSRRLDDFERRGWRNRVTIVSGPVVEYVSMTNRDDDADDRVVVHVEATLDDMVIDNWGRQINRDGSATSRRRLDEYWTLGKGEGGGWILLSIEQGAEGEHNLASELVATPWDDTSRLSDESLLEGATADKLPENGVSAGELVSVGYENDARAAALDLSLVDGRFAPNVLEVAVRRVVEAWAEAVDGSDARLRELSSDEALAELLHPGDASGRTRVVVRGPRVRAVTIEALDAHATPPRMTVAVEAEGRRYIEDRDTTQVISGDPNRSTRFTERWTLALDGDDANPWRVVYLIRNGRRARVG